MTDHLKILGGEQPPAQDFDALRARAAELLERALVFVEEHGNEFSKLRARILVELDPVERGVAWLAERQADDGSLPPCGEIFTGPIARELPGFDTSGKIVGTLEALSVLTDWKHLYDEVCNRAVDFLWAAQEPDGGFGPVSSTPPDPVVRVFATGMAAGFLGRTRNVRPETLTAAGRYLSDFWSVEYIRTNGWPAVAAFAHYFTNVHDEEGEAALPWCSRELERGGLVGDYSACQQMRVLFYCEADALPGVDFNSNALLAQLLDEQRPDGSCPAVVAAEGQPVDRVGSTLDAMMFTLRLCRAGGQ